MNKYQASLNRIKNNVPIMQKEFDTLQELINLNKWHWGGEKPRDEKKKLVLVVGKIGTYYEVAWFNQEEERWHPIHIISVLGWKDIEEFKLNENR